MFYLCHSPAILYTVGAGERERDAAVPVLPGRVQPALRGRVPHAPAMDRPKAIKPISSVQRDG